MARPLRKKLKFDEDSVNKLLQEIYDDTYNIKAKITRLFTKWEAKVKEGGEIAALGDQIVKLLGAESKNQEHKLMILKYLKEVVFEKGKSSKNDPSDEEKGVVSDKRRADILSMVQKEWENK